MKKRTPSTYEREMQNPEFKKLFEEDYKELVLSELLYNLMESENKSVRGLAREAHLSPTVIQNIRTGHQEDIKLKNFLGIMHACGYNVVLKKGPVQISI